MKKKSYVCIAAAVAALTFTACGDDKKPSSNGGDESAVKQVNRVDDLGGCNKNKFGEIIYVAETDSLYECTGSGWVATDSSAIEDLLSGSSSSESDEDDSSDSKSSSSFKTDSSDVADVETVKVDSVTLKGFAQKGPFASGTAVTVYGLDSLLEKTKTKFTGKVAGDSGAFKVENIALPSQFALVEVSGFFKSEVSGKNTSGTKTTLSAIVDLSEGKSVKANVNLFTTLEYARVKQLVAKDGFNVPAAKKRATAELLTFFGAKGDDLTATSISLDTTAAGEALLTASVMLVSDLSASKFGSRLSDVADLFAESGIVADEELLVSIADWASKVDSTDNFESIRKNVKEMKLFESVPDFDGYIYKFWITEYKLGACTDSLEETIKKNENKKSDNYGAGYACTSKRWHKSTALDTDLGLCTAKREGNFEERKLEKGSEYYVCKDGSWNEIDDVTYELKLCTEDRENKIEKTKKDEYYKCVDGEWKKSDKLYYELQKAGACTDKNDLDTYETESFGLYVCDSEEWRKATEPENEFGICGKKGVTVDSIYKTSKSNYFVCTDGAWEKSDKDAYEVQQLGPCTQPMNFETHETESHKKYVCENLEWREQTSLENDIGVCGSKDVVANHVYKTSDNNYYVCSQGRWTQSDLTAYELQLAGKCTASNRFKSTRITAGIYICDSDGWRPITQTEISYGVCGSDSVKINEVTKQDDTTYYRCEDSGWDELKCNYSGKIDTLTYGTKQYYCWGTYGTPYKWIEMKWEDTRSHADGSKHTYKLVRIGKHIWMAEDLRYNGKLGGGTKQTNEKCAPKGYYLKSEANLACGDNLTDWYLPSSYSIFWDDLNSWDIAALKSKAGWTTQGTNASGFNAIPSGRCDGSTGEIYDYGDYAQFWNNSTSSSVYFMINNEKIVTSNPVAQGNYLPVRCVRY